MHSPVAALGEGAATLNKGMHNVFDQRGRPRRSDPVAADVSDHQGHFAVFDLEDIVEVAPDPGSLGGRAIEVSYPERSYLGRNVEQGKLEFSAMSSCCR